MHRKIAVTSALPYANGPIHIGHLVEYVQTDIWVRFQKLCGNECLYFCADDAHGTPIMISAQSEGIKPEELIERVHKEHRKDFEGFLVEFDNYYTTHSPENREFSELIFNRLKEAGSIDKRVVSQCYCPSCGMFLPDRYIRGMCPRCKSPDQYGDSCDKCGGAYRAVELIDASCATCGTSPVLKDSEHYFFRLADYEQQLKDLMSGGYAQKSAVNKLEEWFEAGLKDWDISRDGPYFGFKIPGEQDKYFYVWLDAPIGYMASAKNYCQRTGFDFAKVWPDGQSQAEGRYELYHFIGKDIMYFHALFWPAMLLGSGFRPADRLFVHGFLTVEGQKMSKSKGTFIRASTYLRHLDAEYLRYYYASKLSSTIDDIDFSLQDFVNRTNSELVGKFANLASRSCPMVAGRFDSRLGELDVGGRELVGRLLGAKDEIIAGYERLNYAEAVRTINFLADEVNRYIERNQPWVTIKDEPSKAWAALTAVISSVRILATYLKPILPKFAGKVEKLLNIDELNFSNVDSLPANHKINKFERLMERIDKERVTEMIEESKQRQQPEDEAAESSEAFKPECTIEDFGRIDFRIARVKKAEEVAGADKLLRLVLDVGGVEKQALAGIAEAYSVDELVGRRVVYLANLKPRKMRFGVSEGMILAAGEGGKDIHLLTVDEGAKSGWKVS